MNTSKYSPISHEECELMLPSYIHARLDSEGQRAVQEHIAQCGDCFNAMQEAKSLSDSLEMVDEPMEALLSPAAAKKSLTSVLDRIDMASERKQAVENNTIGNDVTKNNRRETQPNKVVELSGWRGDWNRSPQKVRRIVVAQAACLMVAITFMAVYPFQASVNYQTLSEPQKQFSAVSTSDYQIYRLIFHPESTEITIRNLLASIDGKIVNGPSNVGVYDVAVLNNPIESESILEILRSNPQVKLAEPAVHRDGESL